MFTIYSKDQCAKCNQAKMLLDMKGVDYDVKMLGKDFEREFVLSLEPTPREFPVVFKGEEFVGGLNELKKLVA
ncbi:MAG: glutaredoxin [Bacteroidales bacterium]|nr:glutaredoxin [Candidatus Scybalousia scybalohippi]